MQNSPSAVLALRATIISRSPSTFVRTNGFAKRPYCRPFNLMLSLQRHSPNSIYWATITLVSTLYVVLYLPLPLPQHGSGILIELLILLLFFSRFFSHSCFYVRRYESGVQVRTGADKVTRHETCAVARATRLIVSSPLRHTNFLVSSYELT
jgi:hypothetical protein